MKIALVGAAGTIGSRIGGEALSRGHQIIAVVRDARKLVDRRLSAVIGDVTNADSLVRAVKGVDAVVSAVGPDWGAPPAMVVDAAKALMEALPRAGVKRLLVVGAAGSLEVKPGLQLVDSPTFPEAWKPASLAHREALQLFRKNTTLDWTYVSPAAQIGPGPRTGRYRVGSDQLLVDAKGESRISAEDFAVALIDELEKPHHLRKRITVAY